MFKQTYLDLGWTYDEAYGETMYDLIQLYPREEYLKAKAYHHSDDAHTYAMTALYNPIVERLWEILREVDFSKIESEK